MSKTPPAARTPQSRLAKAEADLALAQVERLKALARLAESPEDQSAADELEAISHEIEELRRAVAAAERDLRDLEAAQSSAGRAQALQAARHRAQALQVNQRLRLEIAQQVMTAIDALGPLLVEYAALAAEAGNATATLLRKAPGDPSSAISSAAGLVLFGEAIAHALCRTGLPGLLPTAPAMVLEPPAGGGTPPEVTMAALQRAFNRVNATVAAHLDAQAAALMSAAAGAATPPQEATA